jgi:hypothetical protein
MSEFEALFNFYKKNCPQWILPTPPFPSVDNAFLVQTAQHFMNTLASHPGIKEHQAFVKFIDSEFYVGFTGFYY